MYENPGTAHLPPLPTPISSRGPCVQGAK